MTREIKFRVWDKENKLMLPVEYIDFDKGKQLLVYVLLPNGEENIIKFDFERNTLPIFQFTGLKDKNGKEIYEGDIVETEMQGRHKIEILSTGIWLGVFRMESPIEAEYWEVIGNIYENPQLLTKRITL